MGVNIINRVDADQRRDRDLIDCEESLAANFARVVAAHGSRKAIGAGTWQPTYGELNIAANRVAHALLSRGGTPGDRVAILMKHDGPLVGAILAVHKAGRIAVVLNPFHPPDRLRRLVEDADARLILTDSQHRELAAEAGGSNCEIVQFEGHLGREPAHDPDILVTADATAVLTYTSGSTGRPKAVMMPQNQVTHGVRRHNAIMNYRPDDRILFVGSPSGSQGYTTLWCALLNGASLCPFPIMDRGVTGLAGWMRDHGVDVYISSASIFRQFMKTLDEGGHLPFVRVVRLASETATSDDFKAFQRYFSSECRFVHTLANSEVGNLSYLSLTQKDELAEGRIPIGYPSLGLEIQLLDERGKLVAPGQPGDIVVRCRYMSSGYWRNEALTAEHFSIEPDSGLRVFHSSDQARMNADGQLEFRGRKDAQVKVRGYRVDLADVEEALLGVPAVERAIVLPQVLQSSDMRLVAYLTTRDGQSTSAASVRRALRAVLPSQMIPQAFVFVDDFPLTLNGKIDREKLLQMRPSQERPAFEVPKTETEALLAGFWQEEFGLAEIGRQDDFFELGGDSLAAAVIAARVHDALAIELHLGIFAEHPTLIDLAAVVDQMLREGMVEVAPPPMRVPRDAPLRLSFSQERIWNNSQTAEDSPSSVVAGGMRIRGPLDPKVLHECMNYIVQRHEIMRTTFAFADGQPVQVVHPATSILLPYIDLAGASDAEERASLIYKSEAARPFDLIQGPLIRFSLVRISENEHWLLRADHHIISDAWSWKVYFRELALLYEAKLRGDAPPLPACEPLQYADYAAWQRDALRPDHAAYQEAIGWWRALFARRPPRLKLPFKRAKSIKGVDPTEGVIVWGLNPETSHRLNELARTEGVTYYVMRLAVFAAMLAGESGERDLVIGTYMSNRTRLVFQNMFGSFFNLVTLRLECRLNYTFRKWLAVVRERIVETEARAEIPYNELRKGLQRQGTRLPDINVLFRVSHHHEKIRIADLTLTRLDQLVEYMPWLFTVNFDEHNEKSNCRTIFDAGLYPSNAVRDFTDRFIRLIDLASLRPDLSMNELLTISGTRPAGTARIWFRRLSRAGRKLRLLLG